VPARDPIQSIRATELHRIVRVNEEIKTIIATAFRINLMALNAILLSRRAGERARGFGVLASELRLFAQDLTGEMTALGGLMAGMVSTVTGLVQQSRINTLLARARAAGGRPGPWHEPVRLRGEQGLQNRQASLQALDRRLGLALDETERLVDLGGVLARSAKIEAAYGGSFSGALMQVSGEFGDIIDSIRQCLDRLAQLRLKRRAQRRAP
jgi:hypothetical protein